MCHISPHPVGGVAFFFFFLPPQLSISIRAKNTSDGGAGVGDSRTLSEELTGSGVFGWEGVEGGGGIMGRGGVHCKKKEIKKERQKRIGLLFLR